MDGRKASGPLMQGLLSRRIMGGNMKSKKKWFVLTTRRLQSYKSQQEYENEGIFIDCIDLMELQTSRALTSQGSHKNAFEIVTRSKALVFQTTSPELTTKWVEALKQVMMLKFSDAGELPEEKAETARIEQELQKRKSLKFWRNSRSSSTQATEEEEAMTSYDFLESQDVEDDDNNEDVFKAEDSGDKPSVPRPTSVTSSGVDSVSVDDSQDYDVPPARAQDRISEGENDEGICEYDTTTALAHKVSEDEGIEETNEDDEPLYENFSTGSPKKVSTPGIDELKKMVGYEKRPVENDEEDVTELKGIEQLRALLATMP